MFCEAVWHVERRELHRASRGIKQRWVGFWSAGIQGVVMPVNGAFLARKVRAIAGER
jgi:hypothetical protein